MTHTSYRAAEARRVGFRLHLRGEFTAAAAIYDDADLEGASDADLATFYAASASTRWAVGDIEGCRALVGLAVEHADRSQDDEALGWTWVTQGLLATLDGDPQAEGYAFARAARHAARAGDLTTEARLFNNLGHRLTVRGFHEQALIQLERAFARLSQHPDSETARLIDPQLRENYGRALRGLGRNDEALAQFDQARRRWLELGAPQARRSMLCIADTHAAMGNASRAASAYREVIRLSDDGSALHSLVPALAGLARVTVVDDPDECDAALERVLDLPSQIAPVTVQLAAGWVALARGNHPLAITYGRVAERESGRQESAPGQAEALELLSLAVSPDRPDGRLAEARMMWVESEDHIRRSINDVLLARRAGDAAGERAARARLRSLGVRDDADRIAGALLVIGEPPRAGVEVHTLGAFSVTRDGHRVTPAEWPTARSRGLLQVLAAALGHPVSVSVVARRAWGEGGPGDAAAVAQVVEELRTVLDPMHEHPRHHFVDLDGDLVSLDPRTVAVDAVDFATDARFALACAADGSPRAAELLESAAALHTGRFLDGSPDHDWVRTTRARMFQLSQQVRHALVDQWRSEPTRAVPWLVGLVHDDPYDREAQLGLVRALSAVGRTSEAERYYNEYSRRMAEIGEPVDPMPSPAP